MCSYLKYYIMLNNVKNTFTIILEPILYILELFFAFYSKLNSDIYNECPSALSVCFGYSNSSTDLTDKYIHLDAFLSTDIFTFNTV